MWTVFLLLTCVGSISIVYCNDLTMKPSDETKPTGETTPTEETTPTGETNPTSATKLTGETEPTEETAGMKGCGGYPPICGKNEEYYNCSGGCIPRRCSEIGFPLNCDKRCTPGCVCKGSYVRADNGTCIPIPECPSCGGDINAQQGCGSHCGNTCSDYNKPPIRCPIGCIFNGCNCRKGFVYDYNVKACVRPEDCTPICQANEEYSPCANGGCVARHCSQIGKTVPCDKRLCIKGCVCVKGYLRASNGTCVPKDQCTPTCDKPNEVYDKCPAPCPPKRCNVDEALIRCKAPPKPGDPDCKPGCRCADTYYRNATGTCVPKKKCEKPLTCDGPNEVYDPCPGICPPQECGVNPAVVLCMRNPEYGDPACRPSCVCRDGYVRNDAKECIPKDKCPPTCPANEEYSPCVNGGCDARNCSQVGKPVPCVKLDPKSCIKGCVCVKGYLRDSNGICVPKDQCTCYPPICGKNEEYYNCSGGCIPRRCSEIGFPLNCDKRCTPGCVCKGSYVRADNGTCIPIPECPSCGGDINAQQGCGSHCGNTCSDYNKPPIRCPIGCIFNGCNCRKGFVYDYNVKACVRPEDCTPICQANEEYSPCANGGCVARHCSQIGKTVPCDKRLCIKGCVCVKGYLRASNGTCVPKDQCTPTCDKPNEVYDECPAPCPPKRCNVDEALIRCKAPPKPGDPDCKPGCRCADTYYRNATGTCVPKKKCEKPLTCDGPNEVYDPCPGICPPQECGVNLAVILCMRNPEYGDPACRPSCVCRDGYVRNDAKECIPKDKCPPTCPANEEYSPCVNGGCDARNCSQVGKPVPCVKLDPKSCIKGCVCVKGYLRDSDGTCVPKDQCTPNCDKPNEVYDHCPAPCPPKLCNVKEAVIKCAAPPKPGDPECKPGCRCADTYYRNATGTCVPKKKCEKPLPCDQPNEVYDACPSMCPTRECGGAPNKMRCMRPPEYGDPDCRPSCVCRDGYVRNDAKECIPRDQCPKPCGQNEYWEKCIKGCTNQPCADLGQPAMSCPAEIVGQCKSGCRCKPKHYRNSNGVCVPESECPPTCPANEEYSPCVNGGCDARNCSQVGKPVPCVKLDPKSCIKGCVCVKGYLRDSNGICVPKDQCTCYPPICGKNEEYYNCSGGCIPRRCSEIGFPLNCDKRCTPGCVCKGSYVRADNGTCIPIPECPSCGGDINAQQGCGSHCGNTCSDYNKPPIRCPIGCIFNGCNCRKGFVYDYNVKACVRPEDCTPICQANEEYSPCANGGCVARHCSQIGKTVPCDKRLCIKGCVCVKGYLRASNGTCVPKDQCTPTCDKPNEVYDVCPAPCPPKRCNVNEALIRCKAPPKPGDPDCKPGCRCADTYYRNATGTCVPKKKCEKPLTCDGPNEVYDPCPGICPPQECGVNPAVILCMRNPEYGDPACRPSCVCRDGYVRNDAKECIPKDKCPPTCPANEEYSPCVNGGCDARNCSQVGKPVPCVKLDPKSCIKGCVCVKGYLRDSDGTCVPNDQCTPNCDKPNEVYDQCPAPCPPKLCNVNEAVIKCAAPPKPGDPECKPGCRCADTYYRNATGTCVPKKKCEKPLPCDQPNEVYDACPSMCPTRECGGAPNKMRCMRPPEYGDPDCRPSCVCRDGYVRNDAKECIPRDQCPKPCGQNEYWEKCIKGCTNQPCADVGRPAMSCPAEIVGQCKSGCRCKPKHYRNSNGVCVPESECPRCYGLNENWVDCIQGCSNQSCADIGQVFHCPNQPAGQCKSGCRCIPGTWRNASKVCVPQEECPKPDCPCGEIWNWCPTIPCDGDYCPKTRDSPQSCPVGIVCDKPRCVCESNRKRDWKTGKCVSIKDCPKFKCNCNEEYQVCPSPCPGENCSDYINGLPRCPPYKYVCRPQCRCIKDYYRDADGTCIPSCHCPKETSITTTTEPPTTSETSTGASGTGLTGILDGITVFTGVCLYNRMQSAPSENIIMSAMSVFTPIAELCLWSEGGAYDQCIKILNLKDKQDIRDTFPKLRASSEGQTSVNFSTAEKIYSDEKHKLNNGFKEELLQVFKAGTQELDFGKNKEAADTINAWVESKTNNHIKDLVTPDMLSPSTRLVLINAIYFKGTWLYEFNKNDTKDEVFYLNDGTTKQTKMMYREIKDLDYADIPSLDCQAVRMYYKGKTSSMIIVLPNTKNGTMALAKKLQDPANWKKITDNLSPQKVQLHIPQFKITTTTDLKDLLKKANITDWFNCQNSGLKGLLQIPEDVCITEAIQKAFIEVYEEGAEAAAANAVVVTTRSLSFPSPVIKEFKANRAFLYYLGVGSIVTLCGAFNG